MTKKPSVSSLGLLKPVLAMSLISLSACGGNSKSDSSANASVQAAAAIPEGTTVNLALLETSDLHQYVLGYNYYSLSADASVGLDRTSTLVSAARAENPNNVLLDDGDAIQGTLLGDFQAQAQPIPCGSTLAIHRAMNLMGYDGGGLGNHEFNYGLPFLSQVLNADMGISGVSKPAGNCGAPNFPVVASNVLNSANDQPILKPYAVMTKTFVAQKPDGSAINVPVNIGIMSFVPPQIVDWDAKYLAGKVYVAGSVETAQKYVPELRAKGADLVVALSHGGFDASGYSPKMENQSYYLSQISGIDALLAGHSHLIFPAAKEPSAPALDASLAALPKATVDSVNGFMNGVPTVMPQSWGRRLGIIKMTLMYHSGKWAVQKDKTTVEARGFKYTDGKTSVAADPAISNLIANEHLAAINYAQQSLGVATNFEMSAYFSLVGDVSAIQIVNQAQIDYVKNFLANTTDSTLQSYRSIPVISCSAPFKAGRNGATDFTDVAPTATSAAPVALQVRNPGDLYLYGNNNIQAVKIKGSDLKAWLETSAKQFAQIDPTKTSAQDLVPSYSTIYNFDVFYAEGNALTYQVDVTKPVGSRIVNLKYQGQAVSDTADFIVATNDYRAGGGGNFSGIDGSKTIIKSPDANQTVVANYLKKQSAITRANNGQGQSWSFVKTTTAGPVVLRSAPGKLAVANTMGLSQVTTEGSTDANGYALYTIDLSK